MLENAPQTVPEAVDFLDKEYPGWANKIDLKRFNINSFEDCVLGQLFGDYIDAKVKLFKNCADGGAFANSQSKWIEEITKRQFMNNMGTFNWALEQLKNGKKVRHKSFMGDVYWYTQGDDIVSTQPNINARWRFNLGYLDGWTLFGDTLESIKPGTKFRLPNNSTVYQKISNLASYQNHSCYINVSNGEFKACKNSDDGNIVEVVE